MTEIDMLEAALKESTLEDSTLEDSTVEALTPVETLTTEGTNTGEDTLVDGLLAESFHQEPPKREEPWVLVKSRKGGRPKPVPKPADVKTIKFEPTIKAMTPLPLLSKEAIAGQHFYTYREYKQSREYRVLKAIIKEFVRDTFKDSASGEDPVRKAVCLGIGSFDPENGSWTVKEKAHVQLAAFLLIVEEIEKFCKKPIKCIFQEPAFEVSDIAFITSLGHEVVESPAAFDAVDSHTFLFGVHLYRDVYAHAFKNGDFPALFIGTGWDVWSDVNYRWEPEECTLDAIEIMEKTHKKFAFPEAKGKNIFYGTSIYWD